MGLRSQLRLKPGDETALYDVAATLYFEMAKRQFYSPKKDDIRRAGFEGQLSQMDYWARRVGGKRATQIKSHAKDDATHLYFEARDAGGYQQALEQKAKRDRAAANEQLDSPFYYDADEMGLLQAAPGQPSYQLQQKATDAFCAAVTAVETAREWERLRAQYRVTVDPVRTSLTGGMEEKLDDARSYARLLGCTDLGRIGKETLVAAKQAVRAAFRKEYGIESPASASEVALLRDLQRLSAQAQR